MHMRGHTCVGFHVDGRRQLLVELADFLDHYADSADLTQVAVFI